MTKKENLGRAPKPQKNTGKLAKSKLDFSQGLYPIKIVKKRAKIDDFSCWLQYENFQKNDDIFHAGQILNSTKTFEVPRNF